MHSKAATLEDDILVANRPKRSRQGVSRILEAVIAAVILLATFSASAVMIQSSNIKVLQERGDLDRLAYNVLNTVIESGVIDKPQTDPTTVKNILLANLPSTIYYNFTVFNCVSTPTGMISVQPDPILNNINNLSYPASFASASEISSVSTMFTSLSGQTRQLRLQLARAGE